MIYNIRYSVAFKKDLKKLGHSETKRILNWIAKNLYNIEDPRNVPSYKILNGKNKGLARYRIGDYRLVVQIENDEIIINLIGVGPRGQVYNVDYNKRKI